MLGFRDVVKLYDQSPETVVAEVSDFSREAFDVNGIPVLICAYNEERDLPVTLASLARSSEAVYPIVVDNGSDDRTAEFAEAMGATVLRETRPSKVFALKHGLRSIAVDASMPRVLLTDADTLVPKHWARINDNCLKKVGDFSVVSGTALYHTVGEKGVSHTFNLVHNLGSLTLHYLRYLKADQLESARGHSMGLSFDSTNTARDVIDSLTSDEIIVDDVVLTENMIAHGANDGFVIDPRSIVFTRGDRIKNFGSLRVAMDSRESRIQHLYPDWVKRLAQKTPSRQT